jgi:tetratricopeptide (TPR) repeat protein
MADGTRNNDAGVNFIQLRETLSKFFSDSDLRNLAFDLNIEYEDLPGSAKADKAREIIAYCRRHNRVHELLAECRRLRPDVALPIPPQKASPESATPTPATQPKPVHQLRNPIADFIGRADEIEELVQALSTAVSETTGATAIIRGLGGLGKTQLANMVALRLRDRFPDSQVFLELQGVSDSAILPERVVQQVIQAFEPQAQVPETLGELQTFYRSILDGKRVLIVADNAKDEAQVRSLEPPPGCVLLVTSRQRFSLPGAIVLNLAALPQAEAEALLLKLCPRIKSSAGRLAELCGRLPLALRVSASLLENDVTQNVGRYLQALEKERLHYLSDPESPNDPNVSVSASLNLSYKALNDARQRILRQISVFPASFDLKAAKAVISLQGVKAGAGDERERQAAMEAAGLAVTSPPTAPVKLRGRAVLPREDESLGILYRRSLVEYDTATERYNLHDLVRAFAAERLKTTDEQIRYVRHYLGVAQQANFLYSKGYEYIFQGLRLFDSERAHIDAAWEWLRQQHDSPSTDDLMLAFAHATDTIGHLRYDRRRDRIPQSEVVVMAAKRLRRKGEQAYSLVRLGYYYRELSETQRAMKLHEQALHICREIGDNIGASEVLNNLGMDYMALGNFRQAIDYHRQCLVLQRDFDMVSSSLVI